MPDPDLPLAEDSVVVGDAPPPRFDLPRIKGKGKDIDKELARREHEHNEKVLRDVLATDAGEEFFMRVIGMCQVYSARIMDDQQQGRRVLGLNLIQEVVAMDPEVYPRLLTRHYKRMIRKRGEEDSLRKNAK